MLYKGISRFVVVFVVVIASGFSLTVSAAEKLDGFVIMNKDTGKFILARGHCNKKVTPASTFKVPLALMGYDRGFLQSENVPKLDYDEVLNLSDREKQQTDPVLWLKASIVWYSQVLTKNLGEDSFKMYVDMFEYGNRDVSGTVGKNDGLTNSWLTSSLQISPVEQVEFLNKMLNKKFPLSEKAYAMIRQIMPRFEAKDGWIVYGKTGTGWQQNDRGLALGDEAIGWFVGWAEKEGQPTIVFAYLVSPPDGAVGGVFARDYVLKNMPRIMQLLPLGGIEMVDKKE